MERMVLRKNYQDNDEYFGDKLCDCDTEFLNNTSNPNQVEVDIFVDWEIYHYHFECPNCKKNFHLKSQVPK